jgi:hypothetical protein
MKYLIFSTSQLISEDVWPNPRQKKAGQIWNASTVVLVFLLGFRARQAGNPRVPDLRVIFFVN